jgi:CMP/dCMP kinase
MDSLVYALFTDDQPGYPQIAQYRGHLMRITVSGLPGSGTTSLARYLATTHGFSLISAGEVFRQMAAERNTDLAEFGALAQQEPGIDRMIDERQKEIALSMDDIIIEGRLSGWMVTCADLKCWLSASLPCRVSRILVRDQVPDTITAARMTEEREECEALRYQQYYGIDIGDLSPYHIVLNSERWSVEGLGEIVDTAIGALKKQNS